MATTLAEIRAKLQAQENKAASFKSGGGGDKAIYPHWNISSGDTATLRFLPDGDSKNDFFWVERQIIKLPFSGIKGQPDSKPVTVQVPCIEMWVPNACPILAEVRPWFKDESLKELGGKYWKKRSYVLQGFVRKNPLKDDETPENPIRRFIMSPSIFPIIKSALLDPELEELPTDYVRGLDFHITKTQKGGAYNKSYADYSTSKWSRKESALTAEEQEAIEKFGLFNLSDFLPKRPTDVELKVMHEMFEASVDGQAYDSEKWGSYYKPYGMATTSTDDTDSADETVESKPAPKAVVEEPVVEEKVEKKQAKPAASGSRAQDIIAAIKARQNK